MKAVYLRGVTSGVRVMGAFINAISHRLSVRVSESHDDSRYERTVRNGAETISFWPRRWKSPTVLPTLPRKINVVEPEFSPPLIFPPRLLIFLSSSRRYVCVCVCVYSTSLSSPSFSSSYPPPLLPVFSPFSFLSFSRVRRYRDTRNDPSIPFFPRSILLSHLYVTQRENALPVCDMERNNGNGNNNESEKHQPRTNAIYTR